MIFNTRGGKTDALSFVGSTIDPKISLRLMGSAWSICLSGTYGTTKIFRPRSSKIFSSKLAQFTCKIMRRRRRVTWLRWLSTTSFWSTLASSRTGVSLRSNNNWSKRKLPRLRPYKTCLSPSFCMLGSSSWPGRLKLSGVSTTCANKNWRKLISTT